ncbi:6-aminohexanoate-dimer hydrolase [Paenibacillus sp. CCS19]|uniref:serine hydrolase domain-containing protein n=1 Tax=Paenibacillus sp. CCS19 TaxID=3158387 RepID=UPI002566D1DE|nr:serine hydrolase domain-containing protein [Paenibacillus cellulosilyticus]GMK37107.1 6-aminohexanoate-dimer hydrolase [Paenibacillus cellulosilyticus]
MLVTRSEYTDTDNAILPIVSAQEANIDHDRLHRNAASFRSLGMRSVVLVKDGALVWEWHDLGEDKVEPLFSCTKSVLSLLIGIASDEGLIRGMEEFASEWIEPFARAADPRIHQITVGHLLTMTSGLEWADFDKPYRAMRKSEDWVAYSAGVPMLHDPGKVFCYNSGGSHLLSSILSQATGHSAMQYATTRLFEPLAIRHAAWSSNNGINEGGTGLHLGSRDLAKLGLLCMRGGYLNGTPIVSTAWLEQTTKSHHKALKHYEPRIYGEYGGHWWVDEGDEASGPFYFAYGHGGQYLIVAPKLDAVIVIRKKPSGRGSGIISRDLFHHSIVPSLTPV